MGFTISTRDRKISLPATARN